MLPIRCRHCTVTLQLAAICTYLHTFYKVVPHMLREDNPFPLGDGGMTRVTLPSNRPLTETLVVWSRAFHCGPVQSSSESAT